MTVRVVVHPDAAALARAVAEEFLALAGSPPPADRMPAVHEVALTGGTIADAIHREIAALAPSAGVDWAGVRFWWGDERFVPADSPDRNAAQARAALLDTLSGLPAGALPADRVMEMPSSDEASDVVAGAAAYGATMRAEGTGDFALVMLGIGPDGHVASLFPGSPQLDVTDRIAVAVTDSPKPPPERISLTFAALNRAEQVWFVASGAEKADAVARALAEVGSVTETPARGLAGPRLTWHLDLPAAAGLSD